MDELKTKMQEYLAIREQYYVAWKAAEDESDAARIRSAELATAGFEAKKARFHAGEDQPAPAEIEWKNALSAEKEAQDAERRARLAFYIAHDNAKRATMEYLREAAAEILSRYTGQMEFYSLWKSIHRSEIREIYFRAGRKEVLTA